MQFLRNSQFPFHISVNYAGWRARNYDAMQNNVEIVLMAVERKKI